ERDGQTRAAGEALARNAEGDAERAREVLSASAAASPAETGRALAAAAASLSTGTGAGDDGSDGAEAALRRRLARDAQTPTASAGETAHPGGEAPEERHLEQL